MARPPLTVAAIAVAALFVWAVHLAIDPDPFATGSAAVLAVSLAVAAVALGAGLLLARAHWARPVTALSGVMGLGLGITTPLDPATIAATALSGVALAAALGPWLTGSLRSIPAAEAPPAAAAVALAATAALPAAIAAVRFDGPGPFDWLLIGVGAGAALGLLRANRAGIWLARAVLPAAGVAAGFAAGLPIGLLVSALAIVAAVPAWHPDVTGAVRPVLPSTGNIAIPPELADPALLAAAGFDDRGRPKGGPS